MSFLIDYLPSYLYPSGERTISQWLIGGISLGGHAAWYTLRHGMWPRPSCDVDRALMSTHRAKNQPEHPYHRWAKLPRILAGDFTDEHTGCPDYLALMSGRAAEKGIPFEPPYIPKTFLALVKQQDPATVPYKAADASNPFYGKKILVLSGAEDKLVPWSASKEFVDNLNVGPDGAKEVTVAPGVGHECTKEMVRNMSRFIWEKALGI